MKSGLGTYLTASALALALLTLAPAGRGDACRPASPRPLVASGLASPTAMEFAPDGRLFVCEQGGTLRVIKNGALLADAVRDA